MIEIHFTISHRYIRIAREKNIWLAIYDMVIVEFSNKKCLISTFTKYISIFQWSTALNQIQLTLNFGNKITIIHAYGIIIEILLHLLEVHWTSWNHAWLDIWFRAAVDSPAARSWRMPGSGCTKTLQTQETLVHTMACWITRSGTFGIPGCWVSPSLNTLHESTSRLVMSTNDHPFIF